MRHSSSHHCSSTLGELWPAAVSGLMTDADKPEVRLELWPESGFTKFRFQDMTRYPKKSHQRHARYDVTSKLSGIPLIRLFRILRHTLEPEFCETEIRSLAEFDLSKNTYCITIHSFRAINRRLAWPSHVNRGEIRPPPSRQKGAEASFGLKWSKLRWIRKIRLKSNAECG